MTRFVASLCLASLALSVAACATQPPVVDDWNRPFKEPAVKPVLIHDMAIANPPHPRPNYVDYTDEPTRFIFRPRNVPVDTTTDDGSGDTTADNGAGNMGGGYVENGILYVDPNQ